MQREHFQDWDPLGTPTYWINHASRALMRDFEQQLRPLGFGLAYLPVVVELEHHGALLQRDLAVLAHVEQPSMAALLARMERDGLIHREPDPADRRAVRISLTPDARARLPRARARMVAVAETALTGFSSAERLTLVALLSRLISNLEDTLDDDS